MKRGHRRWHWAVFILLRCFRVDGMKTLVWTHCFYTLTVFKDCMASYGRSLTFVCILCLKGDSFSHTSFHIPLLHLFISLRYFKARRCLLRVQYVLNLAQILCLCTTCVFFLSLCEWFLWMQAAAGSCFLTSVTS